MVLTQCSMSCSQVRVQLWKMELFSLSSLFLFHYLHPTLSFSPEYPFSDFRPGDPLTCASEKFCKFYDLSSNNDRKVQLLTLKPKEQSIRDAKCHPGSCPIPMVATSWSGLHLLFVHVLLPGAFCLSILQPRGVIESQGTSCQKAF